MFHDTSHSTGHRNNLGQYNTYQCIEDIRTIKDIKHIHQYIKDTGTNNDSSNSGTKVC